MTAALQFRDLTLGYERHPAVHHLDGRIEEGALLAVVGPNGAGKSTLFKGVVGALKPLAGSNAGEGFQFLTDIPSHLAKLTTSEYDPSRGVSIPNGHPQPFSQRNEVVASVTVNVSIPNGHPQPFSLFLTKGGMSSKKVSIPNGHPQPFSL